MRRERTHVNIDGGARQAFRADAGRQVKNRSSCDAEGQEEKGSVLRGRGAVCEGLAVLSTEV